MTTHCSWGLQKISSLIVMVRAATERFDMVNRAQTNTDTSAFNMVWQDWIWACQQNSNQSQHYSANGLYIHHCLIAHWVWCVSLISGKQSDLGDSTSTEASCPIKMPSTLFALFVLEHVKYELILIWKKRKELYLTYLMELIVYFRIFIHKSAEHQFAFISLYDLT